VAGAGEPDDVLIKNNIVINPWVQLDLSIKRAVINKFPEFGFFAYFGSRPVAIRRSKIF